MSRNETSRNETSRNETSRNETSRDRVSSDEARTRAPGGPRHAEDLDDHRLRRALRELPVPEAGDGFTAGVMARIAAAERGAGKREAGTRETCTRGAARGPGRLPAWAAHPALGAVAACLAVALVTLPLWLWSPGGEELAGPASLGPGSPGEAASGVPESETPAHGTPSPRIAATEGPGSGFPAADEGAATETSSPAEDVRRARLREVESLLAQLRREHQRFERELRDLRHLQADAETAGTLYLGGDETLDLVLELPGLPGNGGGVRPAAAKERGPQSL